MHFFFYIYSEGQLNIFDEDDIERGYKIVDGLMLKI